MRLTRLELSGFKSFADDIDLPFGDGVTAIVGPNGCGKSNVSDAVRWVLGEQRARVLRGSKMDEVIFQGSTLRKPTNIAEVSLYFDNSEGVLPVSFSEVVVTRRLSRSGQSDYLINNAPVRLRDVQDLLRGTGLGADAGVVIEARMIDRLLSDRAEERRSLFEEAAGIGLYRDRRNSTERRLERTREDLQRLDDLISEVGTQVRSLARQKGKAERHAKFTEQRFQIVMTLTRKDMARFEGQNRELQAQAEAHREEVPRIEARLSDAGERREEKIQQRASAEARRSELERRMADLRVEVERLEGDLNLGIEKLANASSRKVKAAEEKQEAEQLAAHARIEHDAASQELAAARTDLESVQIELNLRSTDEDESRELVNQQRIAVREVAERLQATAERERSLAGEKTAIEAELADTRPEHARAVSRLEETSQEIERAEASAVAARAAETECAASHQTAEAELESAKHALAAAREAETAITAEKRALEHEMAQLTARRQALEELERNRAGLAPAARRLLEASDRFEEGAIIGPLTDYLTPEQGQAQLAERALSSWLHAVLVRDDAALEQVRTWHGEVKPGPLVLLRLDPGPAAGSAAGDPAIPLSAREPAGAWVRALLQGLHSDDAQGSVFTDAAGAVFLHDASEVGGPLDRRQEMEAHRERIEVVREKLEDAERRGGAAADSIASAETSLVTAGETAEEERAKHRDAIARLEDANRTLERTTREKAEVQESVDRLNQRLEQREARVAEVDRLVAEVSGRRKADEKELTALRQRLEETERNQEQAQEKRVHWQVEEAQVSARERAALERQERSASELAGHEKRATDLATELATLELTDAEVSTLQADRRDGIAERKIEIAEIEKATTQAEKAVREAEAALEKSDAELTEAREGLQRTTEAAHRIEIDLTELAGRRTAMIERIEAEWHRPVDELLAESTELDGDVGVMREEADRLLRAIEGLGPVNSLAVEEHKAEVERFEFLSSQRDDLVEARDGLMRALKEMDETARVMFADSFALIRENYFTVFNTLFDGGNCDLVLTDPDDPLNSEIDIQAAPRGKRTQRIHLLSSGERALVAISLLFAIYLAKPSPFCLLDEVDAPLDDSNVLRFVRLLDEFKDETQFIVITHNPRTMQVADSVFGVTMEEPGVSKIVGVRLGEVEPMAS